MNIQVVENTKEVSPAAVEATSRTSTRQQPDAQAKDTAPVAKSGSGQEMTGQEKEKLLSDMQDYFQSKGVNLHFKMLDSLKEVQVEMAGRADQQGHPQDSRGRTW